MTRENIIVRTATADDAGRIAKFNAHMALETEGIVLDAATVLSGTAHLIENPDCGFYLVAVAGDEIAASLMVTMEWSDWRNGTFWWIQSVYVAPQWRRKGLYRRLYSKVKQLADKNGSVCGYRLYVEKENAAAQLTYQNLGMRECHYKMYEELVSGAA